LGETHDAVEATVHEPLERATPGEQVDAEEMPAFTVLVVVVAVEVVVHVDAPADEVVPLAHAVHDDFPVVLAYVPAEHAVWAEAPLDPT